MMAEAWGKPPAARHRHGDTRPGRDQRLGRPACRAAGFDADDHVRRPGRARACAAARRSRRSTSTHSSARWRSGSTRSTTPSAIPEFVSRAFHEATSGRPGPVVLCAAGGHASRHATAAERRRLGAGRDLSRPDPDGAAPEAAVGGEAAARHPRRLALERGGGRRRATLCRALRSAGRLLVPPPDAVRPRPSELCRRCRHRHQSGARRARARRPTCSSSSAAG